PVNPARQSTRSSPLPGFLLGVGGAIVVACVVGYVVVGTLAPDKGSDKASKDVQKPVEIAKPIEPPPKPEDRPQPSDKAQKDAAGFNERGNQYFAKQDWTRAISDYTAAIVLDSKTTKYYYNRGRAYYENGDYDHAIADYDEAIRVDPSN